jgi:hypothetical protein
MVITVATGKGLQPVDLEAFVTIQILVTAFMQLSFECRTSCSSGVLLPFNGIQGLRGPAY